MGTCAPAEPSSASPPPPPSGRRRAGGARGSRTAASASRARRAGSTIRGSDFSEFRQDVGFGFRWFSPIGPLRFEWGIPLTRRPEDDRILFEFITLEGAQAGLSWSTVLKKRDNYRRAFADFDVDGRLDLFVANYIDMRLDALPPFGKGKYCEFLGMPVQCGPRGLPGAGDSLFRNDRRGSMWR